MTSLVTAGLYIWTGLEAAICTIQLLQHGRTFNLERVRLDECGDQFQRQRSRRLWMLYASVAGACSKCQRYQNPVNDEIRTPAHDVEKARDCQKEPLEVASSEGSDSQDQRCRSHTTGLRLVRNLAGMLLLYPVCMLVMSSYAASRGLLQDLGAFESSQVQIDILPQFLLRPSPLVFFLASVIWTVLEYVHYQSNPEDSLQKTILGATVILGLLPCIRYTSSALGILIYTTPWVIHAGLIVGDLVHSR